MRKPFSQIQDAGVPDFFAKRAEFFVALSGTKSTTHALIDGASASQGRRLWGQKRHFSKRHPKAIK
jgi:hypothetical protein